MASWAEELPGVPLWIIFTNKKMISATGKNLRKVRLAFCRFSCQMTERWQIYCSETHSPCWATSWQVLLDRRRCSLANTSGRVEFYTPVYHGPLDCGNWYNAVVLCRPLLPKCKKKKKIQTNNWLRIFLPRYKADLPCCPFLTPKCPQTIKKEIPTNYGSPIFWRVLVLFKTSEKK